MTTQTEALKLALEALERIDLWLKARYSGIGLVGVELDAITAIKEALSELEQDDEVLGFNGWGFPIEKPSQLEHEKERCVGCEACIDTACGRDECPKGWPKAAQPEQRPVAWMGAHDPTDLYHRKPPQADVVPLYTTPPQPKEPEQEPVAWMLEGWGPDCGPYFEIYRDDEMGWRNKKEWTPLYTTPPQRKPLTDEQIRSMEHEYIRRRDFARAIEAAHGIKE